MASLIPRLLPMQVMHKRLHPKVNGFCYGAYYLVIPLQAIEDGSLAKTLAVNRFGLSGFYLRDHGYRDGSSLQKWAQDTFIAHDVPLPQRMILICIPRILGYVFNPVSFWLGYDPQDNLRAVLCEVNNTFGETHTYLCAHDDHRVIQSGERLKGQKMFHVSPFLKRTGSYQLRFSITTKTCHIQIDHLDENDHKDLLTSVYGDFTAFTSTSLRRAFYQHPLMTFKVITLIHYQAFKLLAKGVRYLAKPKPLPFKSSR